MATLTKKESEVLLALFKDFNNDYNANSISKQIKITPRGALKVLKNLEKEKLLKSKKFGKAVFYKANLEDIYATKTIEALLIREARLKANRWLYEFEDIYKDAEAVLIFGSIIQNFSQAKDIDVLFVLKKNKYKEIRSFIDKKQKILTKPLHPILQTAKDMKKNLKEKNNPALLSAVRTGYVLHGYDKIVEIMKNVTSF